MIYEKLEKNEKSPIENIEIETPNSIQVAKELQTTQTISQIQEKIEKQQQNIPLNYEEKIVFK